MMLTMNISKENLVESMRDMDREDLTEVIREVDLMVAEVDFTYDVVRTLLLSLKSDVEAPKKIDKLIEDLKKAVE